MKNTTFKTYFSFTTYYLIDIITTMIKELTNVFQLTPYEAKIYLASSRLGKANLTSLARATNISRTAAYPPIQGLLKRGMLSSFKIKKRKYYQAINPNQLRHLYEQKKVDLDWIVTELTKTLSIPGGSLEIRYFPGLSGVATASEIFLEESQSKLVRSFDNPTAIPQLIRFYQLNDQIKRRVEKGTKLQMIVSVPKILSWMKKYHDRDKEELRETIFISPHLYPFEATVAVDDQRVLIVLLKAEPSAILIDNTELAKTIGSIHRLTWDHYKI